MRLRFFLVPVHSAEDAATALTPYSGDRPPVRRRRRQQRLGHLSFDDSGADATPRPAIGKRGKVDFKDTLSPPEFAVFSRLRALRKERADAEGVPAYALFTNDQLAEMVQRRVTSAAALREIPGVGEARVEKYGEAFLHIVKEAALPQAAIAEHEA